MIKFSTTLLKFDDKGEKTGWTYIDIPAELAEKLKPGAKKSFRLKGKIDNYSFAGIALWPMGEGDFILPLNAAIRKGIGKRKGAIVKVQFEVDESPVLLSSTLIECLADEPKAEAFFKQLPKSEQNYFSKWIDSAKTEPTKAKRIAQAINGFIKGYRFGEMIRSLRTDVETRR
jgi:hypothetical protein